MRLFLRFWDWMSRKKLQKVMQSKTNLTDWHFEFTACTMLLIERHQRKKHALILHICCETEDNYQDRGIKVRSAMQNGRSAAPFARWANESRVEKRSRMKLSVGAWAASADVWALKHICLGNNADDAAADSCINEPRGPGTNLRGGSWEAGARRTFYFHCSAEGKQLADD